MNYRLLVAILLLWIAAAPIVNAQVNPKDVTIVRDKWGVPHIYGKTDADAAYGLAWAHSEDDFETIQHLFLAVNGQLGSVRGKGGAVLDFIYHMIGVDETVDARFDTSFKKESLIYMQAYVDGLNAFAEKYPKEVVRKNIFPITTKDLVKSYTLTQALLTHAYLDIRKLFADKLPIDHLDMPDGSNALAISPTLTQNGKTYLAVNSHQPLQGLFSWYEVHMNSEEGMNILGGTFPGGAAIFHGVTENLGWAATLNHPDLLDTYLLTVKDSAGSKWHKLDNDWIEMTPRHKRVRVKLGFFRLGIKKKFWMSAYGPVVKRKGSYYAFRYPAYFDIKAPEQMFAMNKAKNFTEWKAAVDMGHFAGTNLIYGDKEGNIFYISNGKFPERNPKYNWKKVLPGNTRDNLWEPRFAPVSAVPQYLNPKSGYVFNTNNTPFNGSGYADNLDSTKFEPTFGYFTKDNNRSLRMQEGMAEVMTDGKVTYEEFNTVKYDRQLSRQMYTWNVENIGDVMKIDVKKYSDLADAMDVLKRWNFDTQPENEQATLFVLFMYFIKESVLENVSMYDTDTRTEEELAEYLREAKKFLMKKYGKLEVPLGEVQKHIRGDVMLPVGGAVDVLAAAATDIHKKKYLKVTIGDSYIMMVQFGPDGVEVETVNAYGSSAEEDSWHYTDQMDMYVKQELKPMTLNKEEVFENARKVYHPE